MTGYLPFRGMETGFNSGLGGYIVCFLELIFLYLDGIGIKLMFYCLLRCNVLLNAAAPNAPFLIT